MAGPRRLSPEQGRVGPAYSLTGVDEGLIAVAPPRFPAMFRPGTALTCPEALSENGAIAVLDPNCP